MLSTLKAFNSAPKPAFESLSLLLPPHFLKWNFLSKVSALTKGNQTLYTHFFFSFTLVEREQRLELEGQHQVLLPFSSCVTWRKALGFLCFCFLKCCKYYSVLPNATYLQCPKVYVCKKLVVANKAPYTCQICLMLCQFSVVFHILCISVTLDLFHLHILDVFQLYYKLKHSLPGWELIPHT